MLGSDAGDMLEDDEDAKMLSVASVNSVKVREKDGLIITIAKSDMGHGRPGLPHESFSCRIK
jgi:formylmethanofuran dehydrogenase subunit D